MAGCLTASLINAASLEIKVPVLPYREEAFGYQYRLLELALAKSGYQYKIIKKTHDATQERLKLMLKAGKEVNVYWMGTSSQLEKQLIPVRIPLLRGLLGHRVFIINQRDQPRFNNIKTVNDLKNMQAIQGIGWSDIAILEAAGLKTVAGKYKNIFNIINKGGRVDYFPRGVNEAWKEVKVHKPNHPYITVETKIMLVYPFALFFFVSPNQPEIAKALTKGLKESYKDGSFMQHFSQHPSITAIFKQADMDKRLTFIIKNPLMSKETMAIPASYWHTK
ncbi:hypothetical protein [Spartinivicinus ruber]|uniref:hypothetical protein n=1 Tax=Spartinivicinus ruber TaxID=2683272 RepID=UPI0013D7FAD0|nr:hypothetical protein [Spartinivicinus ruber]